MLSIKELSHLAHLSRLSFTEQELEKFSENLNEILSFIQKLDKADTKNVAETSQVTGLENVSRPDEVVVFGNEDALLQCAPHAIENHSIKIPRIM